MKTNLFQFFLVQVISRIVKFFTLHQISKLTKIQCAVFKMVYTQNNQVRILDSILYIIIKSSAVGEDLPVNVGIVDCNLEFGLLKQAIHQLKNGAFPCIINIRLVCYSKYCHLCFLVLNKFLDLLEDLVRHAVIYIPGLSNKSSFRMVLYYKPRVDSYAMAPHSRSRLVEINPGVLVCISDDFPGIYSHVLRKDSQLICKCNVNIPEGILH